MNSERGEVLDYLSMWAVGLGILTMALAPLAIPILALTAVALLPLLVPVIALALVAAIVAGPVLLVRGGVRRLRDRDSGTTPRTQTTTTAEGRAPVAPITGRLGISSRS